MKTAQEINVGIDTGKQQLDIYIGRVEPTGANAKYGEVATE
jgi:hypothetical protein